MGLFKGLAKAGLAKKVITEARKPQNQRKARELFAKLRSRGGKPTTGTR